MCIRDSDIKRDKILSFGLPTRVRINEPVRICKYQEFILHGVDTMKTVVNAILKNNTINVPTPIPSTNVCSIDNKEII